MSMNLSHLLMSAMMLFAFSLFTQLIRSHLKFSPDPTKAHTATCWTASPCMAELNSLSWNLAPSLPA